MNDAPLAPTITPRDPHPDADPDPLLRAFLADRDVPCPTCGYNLRALRVRACPECAAPLALAIASPHARTGPWTAAVVCVAMGLGFDSVVVVLGSIAIGLRGAGAPRAGLYAILAAMSVFALLAGLGLAGVIALVRRRPRWSGVSVRRQVAYAAWIFALVLLVHAAFGVFLATR